MVMDEFLKIDYLSSCGIKTEDYIVLDSLFDAYDKWNKQMVFVWEQNIKVIENKALKQIDDKEIDYIFEKINDVLREKVYKSWSIFMESHSEEMGLDEEFIDMIIRDMS